MLWNFNSNFYTLPYALCFISFYLFIYFPRNFLSVTMYHFWNPTSFTYTQHSKDVSSKRNQIIKKKIGDISDFDIEETRMKSGNSCWLLTGWLGLKNESSQITSLQIRKMYVKSNHLSASGMARNALILYDYLERCCKNANTCILGVPGVASFDIP